MSNRSINRLVYDYRPRLAFLLGITIVLEWARHGRPHSLLNFADMIHVVGVVLLICGLLLRSWAAGMIHKGRVLATTGPYALIRHPLHVGTFLVWLGTIGIFEDVFALLVVVLVLPFIYINVINAEESSLSERFGGEWQNYILSTPSLLPYHIRQYRRGKWQRRQWGKNKEWRVVWGSVVVLLVLELWNMSMMG